MGALLISLSSILRTQALAYPKVVPSELDALLPPPLSHTHRPRRARMIEDSILQCLYP
jgi:hypothetical protein